MTDPEIKAPDVYLTLADYLRRIRELAEYGYAEGRDGLPYGQSACAQILELMDKAPPPGLAQVQGIEHFHHLRAMSQQRIPCTIPDNAIEVTLPIFTEVMNADNTMGRRKWANAYEYVCRLGVAGWLVWGKAAHYEKDSSGFTQLGPHAKLVPAIPTRYLLDPTYAQRIKFEVVMPGRVSYSNDSLPLTNEDLARLR